MTVSDLHDGAQTNASINEGSDVNAPSSSAEGSAQPKTLMDAIKAVVDVADEPDVLEAGEKTPASSAEGSGEPPAPVDAKADPATTQDTKNEDVVPDGPLTAEERKQLPHRTAKRIDKLLEQRSALSQRLEALADVERTVSEVGIAQDDLRLLMNVGATLQKGDFEAFLQQIEPYYRVAMEATGRALPEDLRKKVDEGLLDTEAAADVSRNRYKAQLAESQVARMASQREQEQAGQAVAAIRSSADAWEVQIRQRDPDYEKKQEAVKTQTMALIHQYGYPKSPQAAVQYAEEAYKRVNAMFEVARPKMQPTRPTPSGLSSSSTSVSPQPKSLMEAAMAGLRKSRS